MAECPRCHTLYDDVPAYCGVCGVKMPGVEPVIAPEGDPLIGMIIDGRYRIIDQIGRGGMGAVYRVEHVKMGKIMAMKLLHGELASRPEMAKRFKREAVAVSQLSHINTVTVFDFGSDRGMMYLVMEYIDGRDLARIVRSKGPLPFERAAYILVQVCSALVEAHSKGIVHRDIKPENILVCSLEDQEDFVKVLDFGLAKLRDAGNKPPTRLTGKGCLLGTPYYMAPEYIRGNGAEPRSDVYAVGAVMYKLLTGKPAYNADSPMGVLSKHLTAKLELPSARFPDLQIPTAADRVIERAMAKDLDKRFQSARELRRGLVDALETEAPGSVFQRLAARGDEGRREISMLLDLPKDVDRRTTGGVGGTLMKSVIVGDKEMTLGTRSDFFSFEHHMKRKRVVAGIAAILMAVLAVLGGLYYLWNASTVDYLPSLETEPNNTPAQADPLFSNVALAGFIISTDGRQDVDWYRIDRPKGDGHWSLKLEVSGIAGMDMALQLVNPAEEEPILSVNENGSGQGEKLPPVVLLDDRVYLLLQEIRAPGVSPGSFTNASYSIHFSYLAPTAIENLQND